MIKRRFVFSVKYNGFNYSGWQKQVNIVSIQKKIEDAFYKFLNEKVIVYSSGRTDKGVHSLGQVAHCDIYTNLDEVTLLFGLNSCLPADIKINYIREIDSFFDSRYSAICREYKYIIYNNYTNCVFFNNLCFWFKYKVNVDKILYGIEYLIGYHNFFSLRASGCESILFFRTIYEIRISSYKKFLIFSVMANSFLYKMVRIIIGALLYLGSLDLDVEWLKYFLEKKNLLGVKYIVPSHGLYLTNVIYPNKYNLSNINWSFSDIFFELL